MNRMPGYGRVPVVTGILLIVFLLCAGCTSHNDTAQPAAVNTTPVPQPVTSTVTTVPPTASPTPLPYQIYTNPAYSLTMHYPLGWATIEPGTYTTPDFGRFSYHLVDFYKLNATMVTARVFSVYVDPNPATNLENYFSQVTLSLNKAYDGLTITRPNSLYQVSGYRAYRLDFLDANDSTVIEVFTISPTNVPYIFTYDGKEDADFQTMMFSVDITNSTVSG